MVELVCLRGSGKVNETPGWQLNLTDINNILVFTMTSGERDTKLKIFINMCDYKYVICTLYLLIMIKNKIF